ncbi:MAG: SDR family oxidoreductase [Candidatus Eremiobacteraeota bacterium]|nr:SDR family oxidoreductase [Candidatus Eremiobacteraeota bacterium]
MQLEGSSALITGASRGLGLAVATALAKQGVQLVITARDAQELGKAAEVLREHSQVIAIAGDVSDDAHAQRLVAEALVGFGRLDILINSASELGPSPLPQLAGLPIAEYRRILNVNVVAPLRLTQLALPALLAAPEGVVVNVSSDAGVNAYAGWGGYGSSKAALEHWSHILAEELRDSRVRVFVVDPGDMDTRMHRLAEPGVDLSHLPSPVEVAPALVGLLDDTRRFARVEAQRMMREAVSA